ncbi:hypothetical protein ACJX0J_024332, partial [Zea mays]
MALSSAIPLWLYLSDFKRYKEHLAGGYGDVPILVEEDEATNDVSIHMTPHETEERAAVNLTFAQMSLMVPFNAIPTTSAANESVIDDLDEEDDDASLKTLETTLHLRAENLNLMLVHRVFPAAG